MKNLNRIFHIVTYYKYICKSSHFFRDLSHQLGAIETQTLSPTNENQAEIENVIMISKTVTTNENSLSPVYKNNLNYVRKRPKNTLTMADLEREKDLEEDEFKTTAKPSTSRTLTTRIRNKNVNYQCDMDKSDLHEDSNDDSYE